MRAGSSSPPGHEIPEGEDVVVRKDEFFVVRKRDDTAHIVEERDPRSRDR